MCSLIDNINVIGNISNYPVNIPQEGHEERKSEESQESIKEEIITCNAFKNLGFKEELTQLFQRKIASQPPIHFVACNLMANPFPSHPFKNIYSTLKIASLPHLQAFRKVYLCADGNIPEPSASHSFAEWTLKEQKEATTQLQQLGVPLNSDLIEKIYTLLHDHEEFLCRNPNVSYPALYKAICSYQSENEKKTFKKGSFELEIHTDKKATLLFQNFEQTFISRGTAKIILQSFALGKPKLTVYSMAVPPRLNKSTSAFTIYEEFANREESCFKQFANRAWLPKVYSIAYYHIKVNQQEFKQQVMDMEFYPADLFKICESPLSPDEKLSYSIQLMQAIVDLHSQGIVHRDIKLENILIEKEQQDSQKKDQLNQRRVVLNDFGLSIHHQHPDFKNTHVGTVPYLAPEVLRREFIRYGFAIDVWAAGCVLWHIWAGCYPWYEEANKVPYNARAILQRMLNFEYQRVDSRNRAHLLIRNMLRFEPEKRWSAQQVLDKLQSWVS